ncbi:BTAD domain-containing putative transcriptional regulator [Streptosporangium sp. NPDC049644]|uniref:BTAD domain-containing putative transcriptional regulator n=1 Tax=Streptosporangium sp. NPDC049644 TaxID=3155507 RepID=UPI00343A57F1
MILSHKVQPPGLPRGTITRDRLDEQFAALLESHETIVIFAAAGSGKTVQTRMFATRFGWPLAWLTLDAGDRSPSRLMVYLAEALSGLDPEASRTVETALAEGFPATEVAAMLAESVADASLLLVLDDCEWLVDADETLAVLGVFLDYLPPGVRTVILSREDLSGPIGRMMMQGRIARMSGEDLALNMDEARTLLAAHGQGGRDPAPLMEATKGWIAAVAFDIVPGLQSENGPDALAGFVSREILARLPEEEQDFLLRTSIPAIVTARAAVALCGEKGYRLWQSLGSRHLPATKADRALVYHPRFRQYLREQLQARLPGELPGLQSRYARLLEEIGMHEDAVETYLEAGELEKAADVAERAVAALSARADWLVLLRWLEAFGNQVVESRPVLLGALLRALYGVRRIPEAQALIGRLHQEGVLGDVAKSDPGAVAFVGYAMQWRPAEALELIRNYEGDFRAEAVRYELEAVAGREPVASPPGRDWVDSERVYSWGLLVQGRLDQLLRMLPDEDDWPPRSFFRTPHPLLALVWRGELALARELLDEVPEAIKFGAHTDLWFFHEAWLLWAEGQTEKALWAAESAVEHSRRTRFGWEPCFEVVVGVLQLTLGRVDDARMTLADAISRSAASGNRCYAEWGQTFQGLAYLRIDRPEDAVRVLRTATEAMRAAGRTLMLPFAATYLAEAEARLGHAEAASAAVELAYETANAIGCLFILKNALNDVPGVLRRQIENDVGGTRWRQLVGHQPPEARKRQPAVASERVIVIDVHTHGPVLDLIVDGVPRCSRRTKVLELAAYLTLHPEGVERHRLQERLFPDADPRRGGNYFRQVVHKLRQATGVNLARTSQSHVRWADGLYVDSTDLRFERMIKEAYGLRGAERLERIESTLELVEGPYLPESELEWAEERRHELEVMIVNAAVDAAEVALSLGHLERARQAASFAINRDPFCESAYCVRMQVEGALGAPHAVLAEFQRLTKALAELGVGPMPTTRQLVSELRGI